MVRIWQARDEDYADLCRELLSLADEMEPAPKRLLQVRAASLSQTWSTTALCTEATKSCVSSNLSWLSDNSTPCCLQRSPPVT